MGSEQVCEQEDWYPVKKVLAINKLEAIEEKLNDAIKLLKEHGTASDDLEKLVGQRNQVEEIKEKYIEEWNVKSHTEED